MPLDMSIRNSKQLSGSVYDGLHVCSGAGSGNRVDVDICAGVCEGFNLDLGARKGEVVDGRADACVGKETDVLAGAVVVLRYFSKIIDQ